VISIGTFVPFLIIENQFSYGIVVTGVLAMIYLAAVSLLEIKFGLFVLEVDRLKSLLTKVRNRLSPTAA